MLPCAFVAPNQVARLDINNMEPVFEFMIASFLIMLL